MPKGPLSGYNGWIKTMGEPLGLTHDAFFDRSFGCMLNTPGRALDKEREQQANNTDADNDNIGVVNSLDGRFKHHLLLIRRCAAGRHHVRQMRFRPVGHDRYQQGRTNRTGYLTHGVGYGCSMRV